MDLKIYLIIISIINNSLVVICDDNNTNIDVKAVTNPDNVFNGVYTECFFHLSYSCLQKKTLLYLKELNNLSEVSVIGDYVKFVRINASKYEDEELGSGSTDELAVMIDKAVNDFFNNHILKFNALGRDISIPRNMDEFVGRKKRKGGGGGGGGGHEDGGKKKMLMMAMMCMKMKLMMMVPAMMGMMGMMSFKGMMFSMMSFMLSKMMLLMKILEKKGGAGGIGGAAGSDGGWAASGGGGGAWMPAGGQDFGGGVGGGGGYDANGQWQSRSIEEHLENFRPYAYYSKDDNQKRIATSYDFNLNLDNEDKSYTKSASEFYSNKPEISYVKPTVRYNNQIEAEVLKNPVLVYKKSNVDFSYENDPNSLTDSKQTEENPLIVHSRSKRSITYEKYPAFINHIRQRSDNDKDNTGRIIGKINDVTRKKRSVLDILQNSYMYWMNRLLGVNNNRRANFQRYKVINGVRYVYYPLRPQNPKMPKEVQLTTAVKVAEPIITAEDFNKGEIMEGPVVESRMIKKKFHKMKDTVNNAMEENPWE